MGRQSLRSSLCSILWLVGAHITTFTQPLSSVRARRRATCSTPIMIARPAIKFRLLPTVQRGVLSVGEQFQVIGMVIRLVAVFVMHIFIGPQRATDLLLHHPAMLKIAGAIRHPVNHITIDIDDSSDAPTDTATFHRAIGIVSSRQCALAMQRDLATDGTGIRLGAIGAILGIAGARTVFATPAGNSAGSRVERLAADNASPVRCFGMIVRHELNLLHRLGECHAPGGGPDRAGAFCCLNYSIGRR